MQLLYNCGLRFGLQYFARTHPPATQLIEAFRLLCSGYGWQKFAILFSDGTTESANDFESRLLTAGIEVGVRARVAHELDSNGDRRAALRQINQKRLRIVLLMPAKATDIRGWMLDAYDLGMTGKGWAYLMQGVDSVEVITASAGTYMAGDGRDDDALLAVQGLVNFRPNLQFHAKFQSLVQRAATWDARERHGKAQPARMWASADISTKAYLGFMYDALYALAGVADAEMRAGGRASNGTALMQRLLGGASVEGVTGQVSFDAKGDITVPWIGLNVQNRTMVPVLQYSPSLKLLSTLKPILWPGNTTAVPVDYINPTCNPGEYILESSGNQRQCAVCKKGTYTLESNQKKCAICGNNMDCIGHSVQPRPGYWRSLPFFQTCIANRTATFLSSKMSLNRSEPLHHSRRSSAKVKDSASSPANKPSKKLTKSPAVLVQASGRSSDDNTSSTECLGVLVSSSSDR